MACEENSDCQDTAEHCRMRVLVLDMKDLNSKGLQTVGSTCIFYLVVYGNEAWPGIVGCFLIFLSSRPTPVLFLAFLIDS